MLVGGVVLVFHIAAAIIGLCAGFAAIFLRKGSRAHRQSGTIFFISMLCMSASAVYLALVKVQTINVIVGLLTFYMVVTGWRVVKRRGRAGRLEVGAMVAVLILGASSFFLGHGVAQGTTGLDKDGIPSAAYFVFGSFALLAGGLDARMVIRGGVFGAHRIARHLWRMCFSLLITSISFFNGARSQVLPEIIRSTPIHDIPTLAAALLLVFWLCRVLLSNAYRKSHRM